MQLTRQEIAEEIEKAESGKSELTKAIEAFSKSFLEVREMLHEGTPGKEKEIDEQLLKWVNARLLPGYHSK